MLIDWLVIFERESVLVGFAVAGIIFGGANYLAVSTQ